MRLLVLGATGMLGSAMFKTLASDGGGHEVFGTVRGASATFKGNGAGQIIGGADVENHDSLVRVFAEARPDVVINCVGLVKQLSQVNDPLIALPINALLPHRLAGLCAVGGARLVHVSTDCVFSGSKGNYLESDFPDAYDLYGRSKLLGEVDYPHAVTLRTSIIGHELAGHRSLVGWFLAQEGQVKGFTRAIFSGLPTVELARVVRDFVLPKPELRGLYHVAAEPIDKYKLLSLVAQVYKKKIEIVPDNDFAIDRSLNAGRFTAATGYVAPPWQTLIERMHEFQ
ncbi:dTDP-4-dehydrorhamnose reductase family protein [Polaromonas sp. YR568]|uniref:dTDP-4-dehydrorhamnose reductase family protein n=1 Tax=Polaromonas sp. YR568 TaxID=1855301 RepID=UPI00398BE4A8